MNELSQHRFGMPRTSATRGHPLNFPISTLRKASLLLLGLSLSNPLLGQETTSSSSRALQTANERIQQAPIKGPQSDMQKQMQDAPDAEGFNLLGLAASRQHRYSEAITDYQHALSISPSFDAAKLNLANSYMAQHQTALAKRAYLSFLHDHPNDQNANYALALLLLNNDSPREAITHFSRIHPADLSTNFGLVRAYFSAQQQSDALSLAARISATHKDDAPVHLSLGTLLADEEQYKVAEVEIEKAAALAPADFDTLLQLGRVSLLNNNTERADLALSQALKLEPDSPQALYLLADTYTREQRPLDALDLLIRANKLSPDTPDILYRMATVSMSQGFFEDAIPLLQRAIGLVPSRYEIRSSLGECYLKSGKFQKALEAFTKVLHDHPSARTYAYLGLSDSYLGLYGDAKKSFNNCLIRQPGNDFCLFQLGHLDQVQGQTDQATVIFQKVLRSHPNYADALAELADIAISHKQYTVASSLLTRYVAISDHPASGYYKLARIDGYMHNPARANADLRKFQSDSKAAPSYHPYDHLFDYLEKRSTLVPHIQTQNDLDYLTRQHAIHPDQPEILYDLAAAHLQMGNIVEATQAVAQLDQSQQGNSELLWKVGVLLAQHRLYKEAIQQFTLASAASSAPDDINFDLADAYFKIGSYDDALRSMTRISLKARDEAYLSLLGDIYTHLGEKNKAEAAYRDAISANRYHDQNYLFLALLKLNEGELSGARDTLRAGQKTIPASGEIAWGLGITEALTGNTLGAEKELQRAVDLLPEWQGTYSTLGVLYYQTGQITQARQLLETFQESNPGGALDIAGIERTLSQASGSTQIDVGPLSATKKQQLLHFATLVVDKTL